MGGGHVFEMEFAPRSGVVASVKVKSMRFWLKKDYTQCLDTKACLDTLMDHGTSGLLLRSSNKLQLACLSPSLHPKPLEVEYGTACTAWRDCLNSVGPDVPQSIVDLLLAAGVGEEEEVTSKKSEGLSGHCLHPPTEDAESWDCDCHDRMKQM